MRPVSFCGKKNKLYLYLCIKKVLGKQNHKPRQDKRKGKEKKTLKYDKVMHELKRK